MSDEERDLIDLAAQDFIKSCSELILRARKLIEDYGLSQLSESGGRTQCKEHRSIIIELLQTYLKGIIIIIIIILMGKGQTLTNEQKEKTKT